MRPLLALGVLWLGVALALPSNVRKENINSTPPSETPRALGFVGFPAPIALGIPGSPGNKGNNKPAGTPRALGYVGLPAPIALEIPGSPGNKSGNRPAGLDLKTNLAGLPVFFHGRKRRDVPGPKGQVGAPRPRGQRRHNSETPRALGFVGLPAPIALELPGSPGNKGNNRPAGLDLKTNLAGLPVFFHGRKRRDVPEPIGQEGTPRPPGQRRHNSELKSIASLLHAKLEAQKHSRGRKQKTHQL